METLDTTRRVLMIAYHYPPCAISSGQQRTLSFSRHLPESGWEPIVLTVSQARTLERQTTSLQTFR